MNDTRFEKTIEALTSEKRYKSESEILLSLIDGIEKAFQAGRSRTEVYDALANDGLKMTKGSFFNALHRIRKKNKAQTSTTVERQKEVNSSPKKINKEPDYQQKQAPNKDKKAEEKRHTIRQLEPEKRPKFNFNTADAKPEDLI